MLQVNIEKIIPVTEARDMFNRIIDEVEGTDDLYVLTKNGKPAAIVVGVNHLEKLTGETHTDVVAKIDAVPLSEAADSASGVPQPDEPQATQDFASQDESSNDFFNEGQSDQSDLPSQDLGGQLDEPFPPLASEDNTPNAPASTDLNPSQPATTDYNPTTPSEETDAAVTYNDPAPTGPVSDDTPMSELSETSDPFVEPNDPAPSPDDASSDSDGNIGPDLPPRQDY